MICSGKTAWEACTPGLDTVLQRRVAILPEDAGTDEQARARFRCEALAAASSGTLPFKLRSTADSAPHRYTGNSGSRSNT